ALQGPVGQSIRAVVGEWILRGAAVAQLQAAAQYVRTAGGPAKSVGFEQLQGCTIERAFRRPTAGGADPKRRGEDPNAFFDVPGSALGTAAVTAMLGKWHVRNGVARGFEIQQQRDDRVRVRRHGELDLSPFGQGA